MLWQSPLRAIDRRSNRPGSEETWTIRRTFTTDGSNLLLTQEDEDGKATCYAYLPGTELLTAKLIKDQRPHRPAHLFRL